MEENNQNEVDALCPECGHAFKTFMDRVLHENNRSVGKKEIDCPVCGCGECRIGE